MSVQAMSWVIDYSVHSSNDFVILLMIANHAKSDGTGAWPSVPTLAKEARCSVRAVQYSIQRLVESGELRIDREAGPHKPRVYSIPGVQILHPRGANGDMEGCKSRPRNKEEPSLKQPSKSCEYCFGSGLKGGLTPRSVTKCHCTTTNALSAAASM